MLAVTHGTRKLYICYLSSNINQSVPCPCRRKWKASNYYNLEAKGRFKRYTKDHFYIPKTTWKTLIWITFSIVNTLCCPTSRFTHYFHPLWTEYVNVFEERNYFCVYADFTNKGVDLVDLRHLCNRKTGEPNYPTLLGNVETFHPPKIEWCFNSQVESPLPPTLLKKKENR